MADFHKFLSDNRACGDARLWCQGRGLDAAWTACERGDWLLWLAAKAGVDCREAALAVARGVQHIDGTGVARDALDVVAKSLVCCSLSKWDLERAELDVAKTLRQCTTMASEQALTCAMRVLLSCADMHYAPANAALAQAFASGQCETWEQVWTVPAFFAGLRDSAETVRQFIGIEAVQGGIK